MMSFGEKLKSLRVDVKRLTLAEAANQLNVPRSNLNNWERGIAKPSLETLGKLAIFYNTTVDYLVGLDKNRQSETMVLYEALPEIYRERIRRFLPECLIPVPLYPAKRRQRGFNQSEEIARRLSEAWGIPMRPEILRRIRATRDQKILGTAGRAANVAGAFAVPPGVRAPLRAALVDDVITTGATMDACALALKKAGCRAVISVALTGSGGNLLES